MIYYYHILFYIYNLLLSYHIQHIECSLGVNFEVACTFQRKLPDNIENSTSWDLWKYCSKISCKTDCWRFEKHCPAPAANPASKKKKKRKEKKNPGYWWKAFQEGKDDQIALNPGSESSPTSSLLRLNLFSRSQNRQAALGCCFLGC